MSVASGTRKRKRVAEDTPGQTKQAGQSALPHADLWYEDGNIILATDATLFKVHRSIISRQSGVLKTITLLSEQATQSVEGCPIARLPEDSDDVAQMLYGIYDNRIFMQNKPVSFTAVSAWFWMGTKYDIDYLRDEALSRILACYPDTLDCYDQIEESWSSRPPIVWTPSQDYDVALLAQAHSLLNILPVALYECCAGRPEELTIRLSFDALHTTDPSLPSFDPKILQRLFVGRAELVRQRMSESLCFLDGERSPRCRQSSCRLVSGYMVSLSHKAGVFTDNARTLDDQNDLIDVTCGAQSNLQACADCVNFFKKRHQDGRQKVWDNLRTIFRIPEEL
ncbi:hypothetical protein BV25DRAFT_1804764 [Artomyces pyxidatus]|uniref:Uncharacterized protein n=1 Tax=Artomyces pyxidatus TaxID=48021 RepID=A0ACB8T0Z7_9AGAM|nr:hypothetical protein BV25DRAFT_1804764 [Artomyces pyxidatus]